MRMILKIGKPKGEHFFLKRDAYPASRQERFRISKKKHYPISAKLGFTFVEVMVTLAILSSGIILLSKTFPLCLERMTHLQNRLYAITLLDNRMSTISRMLKSDQVISFLSNPIEEVNVGRETINFKRGMKINQVEGYENLFQVNLSVAWREDNRNIKLNRSTYMSNF